MGPTPKTLSRLDPFGLLHHLHATGFFPLALSNLGASKRISSNPVG
jgi:hypothetical protein